MMNSRARTTRIRWASVCTYGLQQTRVRSPGRAPIGCLLYGPQWQWNLMVMEWCGTSHICVGSRSKTWWWMTTVLMSTRMARTTRSWCSHRVKTTMGTRLLHRCGAANGFGKRITNPVSAAGVLSSVLENCGKCGDESCSVLSCGLWSDAIG